MAPQHQAVGKPTKGEQIAAYEQMCEAWRANNNIGWGAGAILISMTAAGIQAALRMPACWPAAVLAACSFLPLEWWVRIMNRLADVTSAQMHAISALEESLGLDAFTRVNATVKDSPLRFRAQWNKVWWVTLLACVFIAAFKVPAVARVVPWLDVPAEGGDSTRRSAGD